MKRFTIHAPGKKTAAFVADYARKADALAFADSLGPAATVTDRRTGKLVPRPPPTRNPGDRIAAGLAQLGPSAAAEVCRSFLIGMLPKDDQEYATDAALAVLRADYYSEIRSLAEECRKQCPEPGEARDRWLEETIDGHQRVIYSYRARISLLCSDCDTAMVDETGETGTVEQQCYHAMLADVRERIAAEEA